MIKWIQRKWIPDLSNIPDPKVRLKCGMISGWIGIFGNVLLFLAKSGIGLLSGSISILADAFNNLSDAGGAVVTMIGFKMAGKPADKEHPFGHGRMEYIAGLVISFFMIVVGIELGKGSLEKILSPEAVEFNLWTILILVLSICVKLWMGYFNRDLGKKIQSETLLATARDSMNDVLTTGGILLSVGISIVFSLNIDGYAGLLIAGYILYSGMITVKHTIDPLLGQPPDPAMVAGIRERLLQYDEIIGVHDLMIHNYGPGRCIASVHAEVCAASAFSQVHEIVDLAEREVSAQYNVLLTIHMDPIETENERVLLLRDMTERIAAAIHPRITIHDFRIVDGERHTKLIFDMVNPSEAEMEDAQLKHLFCQALWQENPNFHAVITVDKDYISG